MPWMGFFQYRSKTTKTVSPMTKKNLKQGGGGLYDDAAEGGWVSSVFGPREIMAPYYYSII